MTNPEHPSDDIVPTSSPPRPTPGDDLRNRPRPSSPSLTGDEVELESKTPPVENTSSSSTTGTNWNPHHPVTTTAWTAVVESLTRRAEDGLWSSREIAIAIAKQTGLTRSRAVDLIASAIRHGYLEERPYPDWCEAHRHGHTQVRLPMEPS